MGSGARRLAGVALTAVLCLLVTGARSAGDEKGEVDGARAALEKWVEIRRVISKEQRDRQLGREMLTERIGIVKREIETLRATIRGTEASVAEAEGKREELAADNRSLEEASAALGSTAAALEARTRELLRRLPDPLRERVRPLSQRLPEDPAAAVRSLSERFQNVVGILNEVNKFNREVTVTSEVRELRGGAKAEVTALYAGIGQAWYVGLGGDAAGVGVASAEGWAWRLADEAAAQIATAIAILANEEVAAFVRLPIRVE